MVTAFMSRLGNLGLLIVASALLLGGLAGAAVVHHFDSASATVASHQAKDGQKQSQVKKPSRRDVRNRGHQQRNVPGGPNAAPDGNSQHTD